jgi:APA family basic amino acid/polyamine antiporter
MKQINPGGGEFHRRLSLFDATMLVAGTMIGSGIFIVSSDIARDVGSSGWLLVVWILTGVMTLIGALSYAELAAMMPQAGGQYVFLREAYSPLWGFLYGWTCFTVIQTGSIAAVAVAFARFLGAIVPGLGTDYILYEIRDLNWIIKLPVPWMDEPLTFFERKHFTISSGQCVAVFIVALLTGWNCRGVQEGKWIQNIFTILKTAALILLIVIGVTIALSADAQHRNFSDSWSGITDMTWNGDSTQYSKVLKISHFPWLTILLVVCAAMVGSLFSADAWNNVTFIAGEMKEPRRDLPRSLAMGTFLVIALYLLANYAYLSALPLHGDKALVEKLDADRKVLAEEDTAAARDKLTAIEKELAYARGIDLAKDDRVGTAIFQRVSPTTGVYFMAIAIMVSTFGCVNGMILMGARLYYAMAKDRLFFAAAGKVNERRVPAVGLILQGVWSILLIFTGSYSELLDYVIFAVLFFYVLTVSGLFVLRKRLPNVERPYRAIGYPVLPFLYVVMCAVIMVALLVVKPVFSWPSFLLVLSGIPIYFLWRGRPDQSASTGIIDLGQN